MSTDTQSLPVYAPLELRLVMSGVQAMRRPRPVYRSLFRISICNAGTCPVQLRGRKWTLRERNGNTRIVEAAGIFNEAPVLTPGAVFSCSGTQEFETPPVAMELRLFGTDELGRPFISEPLRFPRSCFQYK
jgi:uncharacterized protein affecting Mg2+/Co2+ transport